MADIIKSPITNIYNAHSWECPCRNCKALRKEMGEAGIDTDLKSIANWLNKIVSASDSSE